MVRLPHTEQRLIDRVDHGKRTDTKGIVVHTMEGTLTSADSWFRNPDAGGVGAHVGVSDAAVYQWADLSAVCWHAVGANSLYIGIEHEGKAAYTRSQWLSHIKMLTRSGNRIGWICWKYKLGKPQKTVNVFAHADFPAGGHHDPGPGWPWKVHMGIARTAYYWCVVTKGRTWRKQA